MPNQPLIYSYLFLALYLPICTTDIRFCHSCFLCNCHLPPPLWATLISFHLPPNQTEIHCWPHLHPCLPFTSIPISNVYHFSFTFLQTYPLPSHLQFSVYFLSVHILTHHLHLHSLSLIAMYLIYNKTPLPVPLSYCGLSILGTRSPTQSRSPSNSSKLLGDLLSANITREKKAAS